MTSFKIIAQHEFTSQRIIKTIEAEDEMMVLAWTYNNLPSDYYVVDIQPA